MLSFECFEATGDRRQERVDIEQLLLKVEVLLGAVLDVLLEVSSLIWIIH